jgi:hypothetical protein
MTKRSAAKSAFEAKAEAAVARARAIQSNIDHRDASRKRKSKSAAPRQAGQRRYPTKFPPQHQQKPGYEAKLELAPMFEAPAYKGSEKLQDRVAIITGGDSGSPIVGHPFVREEQSVVS